MKHASSFSEFSQGFFASQAYLPVLREMGLISLEAVFAFEDAESLAKANIGSWRYRGRIRLPDGRFAYLKRYTNPPAGMQIKGWLQHGRRAFLSDYDRGPEALAQAGIATPETIAFGGEWNGLFETRSFILSLEIPDGVSLEKQLPACFETEHGQASSFAEAMEDTELERATHKNAFVVKVANFVRRFHATGYRHRDLYLAHLFLAGGKDLYLIDLHRCFRPRLLGRRYAIKDLAQLHYSCPAVKISNTDRIRFFLEYLQQDRLTPADKRMIREIQQKAVRMARHDRKHGRTAPFQCTGTKGTPAC